jgi:hypothetical protein
VDHEFWLFHVDIRLIVACLVFLLGKTQMIIGLFLHMQTTHMYTVRFLHISLLCIKKFVALIIGVI